MSARTFRIPLPWLSARLGAPRSLLARTPTLAEFTRGMPDVFPSTRCYAAFASAEKRRNEITVERWADQVVEVCVISPALIGQVARLGPDRAVVVTALFQRFGWAPRADGRPAGLPGANFSGVLARMSKLLHTPPHVLMTYDVDDWILDYHVMIAPLARRQERQQRRLAMNDPDLPAEIAAEDLDEELLDGE